jgi:hypothetical protein
MRGTPVTKRKTAWLRATIPAAVLAMALSACGSDDSTENEDAAGQEPAAEAPAEETPSDEPPAEEDPAEDVDNAGGDAPAPVEEPEADYALGEASDPILYGWGHGGVANFEVTIDTVDVGEPGDIEGGTGTGTGKPVSVYFTIAQIDGEDVHDGDLGSLLSVQYADGEGWAYAESPEVPGFPVDGGCPADSSEPEVISMGEEFSTCRVVLIPEDVDPATVAWGQEDVRASWSVE